MIETGFLNYEVVGEFVDSGEKVEALSTSCAQQGQKISKHSVRLAALWTTDASVGTPYESGVKFLKTFKNYPGKSNP